MRVLRFDFQAFVDVPTSLAPIGRAERPYPYFRKPAGAIDPTVEGR
jgi:hypothetical protein